MPHLAGFILVAMLHLTAIIALVRLYGHFPGPAATSPTLTTIFLRPAIREADGLPPGPDLSMLVIPIDARLPNLNLPAPPIAYEVARNGGATIAAPILRPDNAVALAPFLVQAALLPGEGATVVLRIEVLATGEPGRIDIDTSSGSRQVDQAAMDYAREHRWYAGRVGSSSQSMWIRWGVRLQA
jgi:protein TonB